ncbi:MAG TPA: hypoxanthine phosphoribosyltransferase [Vicinamibacterales bacterium]|nr:hypoxanthine phosphoribosyltransferase [Vicinamibacterales bacterium]
MTATHVTEFLGADEIQARVKALAGEIRRAAGPDTPVHLVGVLKGAFIFLADLMRAVGGAVSCDFIAVSSYAGTRSTGQVQILKDLDRPIEGRYVVIVEDIVDTGLTLAYLQDVLRTRAPRVLETACLLSKPSRRQVEVPVEHIGFTIDDRFVVGYGLDYDEQYRNLPYIGVVEGTD